MGFGMGRKRHTSNINSLQVLHFLSPLTNSFGQTQFLVLRVVDSAHVSLGLLQPHYIF